MLTDVLDLIGMEVYTDNGILVGSVKDIIIDTDAYKVESIYIERPNPLLIEGGVNIAIPYRWVSSVGDIIVLRFFPRYVKTGYGGKKEETKEKEEEKKGKEG